jgi:hypothetical protein
VSDWIWGEIDKFTDSQLIGRSAKRGVDVYLKVALGAQADLAVELFGGGSDAVECLWENGFTGVMGGPQLRDRASRMSLKLSLGPGEDRDIDPVDRSNLVREVAEAGARCGLTLADTDEQKLLI